MFRTGRRANGTRVYLGGAARTIPPTEHTYVLRYRTDFQLGYFARHDELYWNVTGNGWAFPIDYASATVRLPPDTPFQDLKLEAYIDLEGARGTSYEARVDRATGRVLRDDGRRSAFKPRGAPGSWTRAARPRAFANG